MYLTRLRCFVAATALGLLTLPLHANLVLPGDTVSPDVFPSPGNARVLGDHTGTFNIGGGALTGSWEEIVAVDPFGVTCSGCLDFAFHVSLDPNTDPNVIKAIFVLNPVSFFGYTTDVGYISDSGAVAPVSVMRGPFGAGIVFLLPTSNQMSGNQILTPGKDTDFLIVATNATT